MILINLFLSPLPRLKFDLIFTTGRRLWQHAGAASRLKFLQQPFQKLIFQVLKNLFLRLCALAPLRLIICNNFSINRFVKSLSILLEVVEVSQVKEAWVSSARAARLSSSRSVAQVGREQPIPIMLFHPACQLLVALLCQKEP